ncbi:uncharacterized protein [Erythrolamprus reginae]|uniref:uncharacterized protein n=1 Tax=Erythrolamprus reginae TaxID=121349 RepID=UPI00396C9699
MVYSTKPQNFNLRLLTDAIIFGMRNVTIRNKLLAAEDSSLQDVIKAAQTAEVAEAAAADLKSNDKLLTVCKISEAHRTPGNHPHDYYSQDLDTYEDYCCQIRGPPARQPRPPFQPCAGCRGQHLRSRCPFKDAFCHRCDKRGHIAAVCRATLPDDLSGNQDLLPMFSAQWYYRPFRQQGRGSRRPWNPRGPEEPSSSIDTQVSHEPRRSERTPRRPARLDDYITYLSE